MTIKTFYNVNNLDIREINFILNQIAARVDSIENIKYSVDMSDIPSSATDTGITGQIKCDTGYIYVCIATNIWVRAQLSTW